MFRAVENSERARRIADAIAAQTRYSRSDIARALGVSPSAVTNWCKRGNISRDSMLGLARLLGRPVDYFLFDDADRADAMAEVQEVIDALVAADPARRQLLLRAIRSILEI